MTAPTIPLTYQQAVAAATAIHATQTPAPDPVATLAATSAQIAAARDKSAVWAKSAIHRLWAMVNPYDAAQVKAFTEQAAALMDSAQTAAGRFAAVGQAQQLAAAGIAVSPSPSLPIDVRGAAAVVKKGQLVLHQAASSVDYDGADSSVKVSKADMSTQSVFARPAAVYRYAVSTGTQHDDAQALAGQRIDDLVDDNLMLSQRLAQQQVLVQAVDLDTGKTKSGPRVIGYRRVIHPEKSKGGSCGMCIAASDRIYKVDKLMPIHTHCWCTVAAITEDHDPADDLNAVDLKQLYAHAGGNTVAHLKRTRYQIDEHGELGPVLVPQKGYRGAGYKGRGGKMGTPSAKTESPADVARRNLPTFRATLARLQAEGNAADASKIAYLERMIAKFGDATGE